MTKNKIILLSILSMLIILVILAMAIFRIVTFNVDSDVSNIIIKNSSQKNSGIKIGDKKYIMKKGDYIVIPEGERVSSSPIKFSVSSNKTIKIDPSFSKKYLNKIATKEKSNILNILKKEYPTLIKRYSLKQPEAYHRGEWFGAILVNNESTMDSTLDFYRFVALRSGKSWKIINHPELVLSKNNYKNVPQNILESIDSKDQTSF